jgi:hypothetical protein
VTVALRYALLAAGAALVLGGVVYLFFEVRARPAQAQSPTAVVKSHSPAAPAPASEATEEGQPAPRVTPRTSAKSGEAGGPRPEAPVSREPPRGPDGAPEDPAPHKVDALMDQANKAYDRGDLDDAKEIARRVLATSPNNVRMLRVVVSASCIAGDPAEAQAAFVQLPKPDREQMKTRCARYGVSFTEP